MGEIELNPLIRRLNGWTDSKISRDIVSSRKSAISFEEVIKEKKILLVNANLPDDDIQRMVSSAIIRRLWRIAKSQPKGSRQPFVLLADEFDDILNTEMNIEDMLSNARKFKFGMILMTQYLKKLDDRKVERAVKKLCNTKITYRDPDGDFEGNSDSQAANLDNYTALVKLRIDGSAKGAYRMNGYPPYPPRRTPEEADEWIRQPALQRYGVPKGDIEDTDPLELTENRKQTVLKAVYDSELIDGDEHGVRVADARPRIAARHPNGDDIDHPSEIDALIAEIPAGEGGDIERFEGPDSDIRLRVTAKGRKHIWQTGRNVQAGGIKHTQLLMDSYEPLTALGAQVDIPSEQSTGSMPDATLEPDTHADPHPVLERLTDDSQAVIEAESATGRTKPGKTCENVQKAVENGQRCLILCRPDDAEQIWNTIHDPPFMSSRTADGQNRLYNVRNLVIDGQIMLRPSDATETVWLPEHDGPGFVVRDSNGNEFHRFGSEKAVFQDIGAYPHALPTDSDIPEQWTRVKAPFIPHDLDKAHELVDIVTVPRDDDRTLSVYQDGHHVPIIDLPEWEKQQEEQQKDEIISDLRDKLND